MSVEAASSFYGLLVLSAFAGKSIYLKNRRYNVNSYPRFFKK